MISIKGVIRNGQVVLPRPADLPDGTEVTVLPVNGSEQDDGDQPLRSDEIARLLSLMDKVQPFDMTEEERARWEADRRAHKMMEKAGFDQHADKLRSMWK